MRSARWATEPVVGLVLASWRQHGRHYLATFLAIFLGVGFCAATLSLTSAARRGAGDAVAIRYSKADVVAFAGDQPTAGMVLRISALPDVTAVAVVDTGVLHVTWPGSHVAGPENVSEIPSSDGLRWQQLAAGVFPSSPTQVVVDADLAAAKGVVVGSTLRLDAGSPAQTVTVVGLVRSAKGVEGVSPIFGQAGSLARWRAAAPEHEIDVAGSAGVAQTALAQEVQRIVPSLTVSTTDSLRTEAVSSLSNRVDVLGRFLQGFAVVALLVAGLVIANTFRIVMAQRTREFALLRCVGAERWQVFMMAVGEALLLGVLAGVAGTASGIALAAMLVETLNNTAIAVPLTLVAPALGTLLFPLAGGVAVTVAAVLAPASSAARSAPLTALRPGSEASLVSRGGLLQLCCGALLGVTGSALLALAMATGRLAPGLLGGLVSFIGVLALTPAAVPLAIRLAGEARRLLPRRWQGGVPVELSVLNAVRNPRRTAATAAALLVGVTLISMMSVGAASVSKTESQALDRVTPVDLTVSGGPIPAGLVERARRVDGVQQIAAAQGETVRAGSSAVDVATLRPAATAAVVRDVALRGDLADPSMVVVPVSAQALVPGGGLRPFRIQAGAVSLRLHPVLSSITSGPLLVSPAALNRLRGRLHTTALYVKVSDGADPRAVVSGLQDAIGAVSPHSRLSVDGGYAERTTYDETISVLLLISTGLLGVAVLIALVGVGNTLSLSVLERSREHGLLRALGLTRTQLRLLLANEAVLIAGAAAVLGAALGVGYGWAGTLTLLHGTTNHAPALVLPLARLGLIVSVAVGAGVLASVLPARRAVRVSPVAALAEE
jgi:putative ABC transport system permease protein